MLGRTKSGAMYVAIAVRLSEDGSVSPGVCLRGDHVLVRNFPEAFVKVNPEGVEPTDALVALATMENIDGDGKVRRLHAGQWCHEDDAFVRLHPLQFARPNGDPDE